MEPFRLLVVEDNEQDLKTFRDSIETYSKKNDRIINSTECRTLDEALQTLDSSFDGAIIDLRLKDRADGNKVTQKILDSHFRIPIAILTGTPEGADPALSYIGVFKKGEVEYSHLMDMFWEIHCSGLTRIMGGRGVIETSLNDVFVKNLLPQLKTWIEHGRTNSLRTEKALLRYALNHLQQLLDEDVGLSFPEEVYIHPPFSEGVRTGNIVDRGKDGKRFVVLSPACDLVVREDGYAKSDQILLVEIEQFKTVLTPIFEGADKKSRLNRVQRLVRNNYSDNYYWLPSTSFFGGGFVNFRKLYSTSPDGFRIDFRAPALQISPSFVKDLVARFSSF
jgi:CheY-like chemotaxis protein